MAPSGKRRIGRRILRWIAFVFIFLVLTTSGTWVFARFTLDKFTFSRAMIWMEADVNDYQRFPSRRMEASEDPFLYKEGPGYPNGLDDTLELSESGGRDFGSFLASADTTAFIVIKNGRLVYERYFNGDDRESIQTSFSVAKSFVSALVGIALSEGSIGSLDDPITSYVPELLDRDERFSRITIGHLMSMASGLRYEEEGLPWSDDTVTYYAPDLRAAALEDTEVIEPPGESFLYNNYNPLLLGLVLERATGMTVTDYAEQAIWQPMGAEAAGSWSLDSEGSGFEKMESGINARAIDFAKFGSLYLNEGTFNDHFILSKEWIAASTANSQESDPATNYGYFWWLYLDSSLGDYYMAQGNFGQLIAVFPRKNIVIVRHGTDSGDVNWPDLVAEVAQGL
jgi:CubicO group peptidase (beta-lactamase class C family)